MNRIGRPLTRSHGRGNVELVDSTNNNNNSSLSSNANAPGGSYNQSKKIKDTGYDQPHPSHRTRNHPNAMRNKRNSRVNNNNKGAILVDDTKGSSYQGSGFDQSNNNINSTTSFNIIPPIQSNRKRKQRKRKRELEQHQWTRNNNNNNNNNNNSKSNDDARNDDTDKESSRKIRLPRTREGRLRPGIHLVDFRPDAPKNTTHYILNERENNEKKMSNAMESDTTTTGSVHLPVTIGNTSITSSSTSSNMDAGDNESGYDDNTSDDENTSSGIGTMMHFSRELKAIRRDLSASPGRLRSSNPSPFFSTLHNETGNSSIHLTSLEASRLSIDAENQQDERYDPDVLDEDLRKLSNENLIILRDRIIVELDRRGTNSLQGS